MRTLCMIIGYLHLVSSVADIAYHLLTVAIVTNGFQCDVNMESLHQVTNIPLLEPLLLVLNLGTHGFYPFPRVIRSQYSIYVEYMAVPSVPRCYPGMLHVYLVDVLNFFINLIWLRIVTSYIGALHQKNPEPMRMFFSLSIVKLVMQVMYLGYQPQFYGTVDFETYWFLKLLDIFIAVFFLVIVRKYTHYLKAAIASERIEKPPPYIECLIGTFSISNNDTENYEKKEAVIDVEEEKKEENKPKEPEKTKNDSIYLAE